MFYLSHFLQIIAKAPVTGFIYILTMISIIASVSHFSVLESEIRNRLPEDKAGGHFYALISNKESVSKVQRDMSKLPGIYRVEIMSPKAINEEVKKIISTYKLDSDAVSLDVSGIKVIFEKDMNANMKKMTAEYLVRMVGEEDVTVGPIKDRSDKVKENDFLVFVRNTGAYFICGAQFLLWIIFSVLIYHNVQDRAYLISQFQRRTRVAFKIMLTGVSTLVAISCAAFYFVPGLNALNLLLIASFFILSNMMFLGRLKWEH